MNSLRSSHGRVRVGGRGRDSDCILEPTVKTCFKNYFSFYESFTFSLSREMTQITNIGMGTYIQEIAMTHYLLFYPKPRSLPASSNAPFFKIFFWATF